MIREPSRRVRHGRGIVAWELGIVDEFFEADVVVVLRVAGVENVSVEKGVLVAQMDGLTERP